MEMQIVSLLLLQTLYDMVNQHQLNFSTILNFKGYKENSEGTYVTHANKSLFTKSLSTWSLNLWDPGSLEIGNKSSAAF